MNVDDFNFFVYVDYVVFYMFGDYGFVVGNGEDVFDWY